MPDRTGDIRSYSTLLDAVVNTLARGDLRVEARTWVQAAEAEIFRDCNIQEGDQKTTGTLGSGADTLTLPDNCLDVHQIQLDDTNLTVLTPADLQKISEWRRIDHSNIPKFYWRHGNTLELGPGRGSGDPITYTLWYYGQPPKLSEENQVNEVAQLGWDAYLYGALRHSAPYIGDDPRINTWERFYSGGPGVAGAKQSLKLAYWRSRLSGPLQMRTDFEINDEHAENY